MSGNDEPLPVLSATEALESSEIALHVTPEEIVALRKPPSMIPALLVTPVILVLLSPLGFSLHRELTRRGFTPYARMLSFLLGGMMIPMVLVLIAIFRRRRLERGLKLIDNTVTVLTPDESIAITRFPIADLKDVNIVVDPSATLLGQVCRMVLDRHVGGKLTVFRGCRFDDLQRVAKALYPRMRVRVKGFEVKTGEELEQ